MSLDLSTTSTQAIDPQWTVSADATDLSSLLAATSSAYHLSLPVDSAWNQLPNWIQRFPPNTPASHAVPVGYFTYQTQFIIPCPLTSYSNLALTLTFWADNEVPEILINNNVIGPPCFHPCYQTAPGAIAIIPAANLVSGVNTLRVVVYNKPPGLISGLALSGELIGTCGTACMPDGVLKVCKVAGSGVPVGTPFTFNISSATGTIPLTVPAGPAPDGTCVVGPAFPVGTDVFLMESVPVGLAVTNIAVSPIAQQASVPNLAAGSVGLTIGSGVTEVTYTDANQTGYLEICKQGITTGNVTFGVPNGSPETVVVPAGACSPAIQVPAGQVVIQENVPPGLFMAGCSTVPASAQGACIEISGKSTVTVVAGDISTQTIATITNTSFPPAPTDRRRRKKKH